jgi:hypothetical protein
VHPSLFHTGSRPDGSLSGLQATRLRPDDGRKKFALSTCLGMMTRRLSRSGFAGIGSKGDGAPLFAGGSTGDPTQIICPVLQSFYRVLKYRGSAYHVPHLYSMVYSS